MYVHPKWPDSGQFELNDQFEILSGQFGIRAGDLQFSFIRAPGPGGQNVNKVASAVQLRFDAKSSPSISADMFSRLRGLAGSRMSKDGVIVITAHQFRTQGANREDAVNRLIALLRQAAVRPRRRVATKPSRASKERRLASKQAKGDVKRMRRKPVRDT